MPRLAFIAILFATVASAAETRPHVVTSFLPLYCWAVNVAGEFAVVENLLPPRSEPHEYAFTPGDARKLSSADLIIVNGLGLEPWVPKFLRGAPALQGRIVVANPGMDQGVTLMEHDHEHRNHDRDDSTETLHRNPHVWLDPQRATVGVSNILAALQRIDPAHAAAYASNALAYVGRLQKLDAEIRQSLAGVTNRAIVTYHDAFPYFARRYGLEIAGVVEEVPDVNPTPKYLSGLGRTMRERGLRVIFIAPNARTRLARRIAADLHVELVELDTLESGRLSPSAYEERMRQNAESLKKHLH